MVEAGSGFITKAEFSNAVNAVLVSEDDSAFVTKEMVKKIADLMIESNIK